MVVYNKKRKFQQYVGAAVQVAKTAKRVYDKYQKYKTWKAGTLVGITGQHDRQVQYKKRRMPKYKRRRWVNFVKRVTAATQNRKGTRTFVFNRTTEVTAAAATVQTVVSCMLYGRNGVNVSNTVNAEHGMSDLFDIFNNASYSDSTKIQLMSGLCDITMTNTGTTGIEMDIYEVYFRKSNTAYDNNYNAIVQAQAETVTLGAANSLEITDRGVQLFDIPQFMRNTGCTIFKKVKVFIPVNGTTTYQIKSNKNWFIDRTQAENSTSATPAGLGGYIMPYKTRGIIAVFKGVTGGTAIPKLSIGSTHRYAWKFDTDSRVGDGTL